LKGTWRVGPVDSDCDHSRVHLAGLPKPGPGRPTLLIGGGGRRMLGIAARHADIVGVSAGEITNREELRDRLARSGELIDAKIERVRQVAGERVARLELNGLGLGTEV